MRAAIMQPYIFPYIGYFQLLAAVDVFVFYDDVNFIKQGWINRNKILVNNAEFLFTIPVEKISSFVEIKNTTLHRRNYELWKSGFYKTIQQSYKKAPHYDVVIDLVMKVIGSRVNSISELAQESITAISTYLRINTSFEISSVDFADSKGMEKADRLIEICRRTGANHYINSAGGQALYAKEYFNERGIQLNFIQSLELQYKQFNGEFVPWLSIIDVLMFNSVEDTRKLLTHYTLI